MEKLHDSKYQIINFDKSTSIIYNAWYEETANMSEDDFKEEINTFEREIKRKKPKYILGDPSKLNFPISPDLQDWIAENLFLTISEIGVIKYSIIVAKDLITQLSVEQTVDGEKTGKFIMKYFDDPDKAKEWLLDN